MVDYLNRIRLWLSVTSLRSRSSEFRDGSKAPLTAQETLVLHCGAVASIPWKLPSDGNRDADRVDNWLLWRLEGSVRLLPELSYRWARMRKIGHQAGRETEHEQDGHFAHRTLRKENRIRLRRGNCHGNVTGHGQSKTAVRLKRHRRQAHARMTIHAVQSAL
jgi:hypothetical protein